MQLINMYCIGNPYLKIVFRCTSLVACIVLMMTSTSRDQQSLFNIPSSTITPKGNWFIQEQLNMTDTWQINSTFDYGLGKNWEAGLNLLGLTPTQQTGKWVLLNNDQASDGQVVPAILLNVQKAFSLHTHWKTALGFQVGTHVKNTNKSLLLAYWNNEWVIGKAYHPHVKIYAGIYSATPSYYGPGNRQGLWAGIEVPVWHDHLHLVADFISGTHVNAETVSGCTIFLSKHWLVSLGGILPNLSSVAMSGFVFELTRI